MRAKAGTLALVLGVACASGDEERPASPAAEGTAEPAAPAAAAERGPTRAEREAERGETTEPADDEPRPERRVLAHLAIRAVDAARGEDGHGRLVAARAPVALDLIRDEGWPGRALDPVLHVGELTFTRYEHTSPTVLRYVAADRDALPGAAAAFVQWGDDESSRVALTPMLEVDEGDVRP
jgi:hypothetical protein